MNYVGIVGAGPTGLYVALSLLESGVLSDIHVFEASDTVGGRTRMSSYQGVRVVAGAGIIRERDALLRRLARRFHVRLSRFKTSISRHSDEDIVAIAAALRPKINRSLTFAENFVRILGKRAYRRFIESAGATDFEEADACDTIDDYGFQDNTPGQIMFGVDWDRLMISMLDACRSYPNFHIHLSTPIARVRRTPYCGFVLNDQWIVSDLVWTAPRPSWSTLPVHSKRWKSILKGIGCQPFARIYSAPIDRTLAEHRFPHTTYMPVGNPLQKIIPYRDGVFMVGYCDNESARTVKRITSEMLHQWTGIQWHQPVIFYHACGTHFFRPLDKTLWENRAAFLAYAHNPIPHLYVCGEGLSQNQGWTEGALESANHIIRRLKDNGM